MENSYSIGKLISRQFEVLKYFPKIFWSILIFDLSLVQQFLTVLTDGRRDEDLMKKQKKIITELNAVMMYGLSITDEEPF